MNRDPVILQAARVGRARREKPRYLWAPDPDRPGRALATTLSGETYSVSGSDCTCTDFGVRCRRAGLLCKHLVAFATDRPLMRREDIVRKEFIVERSGKQFVLYAGLLDLAHTEGLKSIETTLVQIPAAENAFTAIATARVVMNNSTAELPSRDRVFTGIGDAAPNNVGPMVKTALIRMSETRAKARALRDAVNVGLAAIEELGPDGEEEPAAQTRTNGAAQGNTIVAGANGTVVRAEAGDKCPFCHVKGAARGTHHGPACESNPAHNPISMTEAREAVKARMGRLKIGCKPADLMGAVLGETPEKWDLGLIKQVLSATDTEWNAAVVTLKATAAP